MVLSLAHLCINVFVSLFVFLLCMCTFLIGFILSYALRVIFLPSVVQDSSPHRS